MSLESSRPAPDGSPNPGAGAGAGAGRRRRLLDDPRSIRTLAHPIRLELQFLIGLKAGISTEEFR
ncbi:hypothetical protein OHB54_45140 [Streptomyces sp. NBC_01007]|nr:hypothetical protein OHB54_45140 [Streptomyces sp. NBC_01007]